MRTTISIQDALLQHAKEASLTRNCSLGEIIEDALRTTLVARSKSGPVRRIRPLKTFRGSGLQPGVDLSSSSGLLEIMEGQ
ncbi:MAG: DUF2191 domain-containing protein [Verrucomicrobiae bacterium]